MKILAIIPCCGYGTRMNMPTDKSKELLPDPYTGSPIIEWHLNLLHSYEIEPFIITRAEKQDLIEYCLKNNIRHMITVPGEEWQHTVFNSHPFWEDHNILIFPDSRYAPLDCLFHIKKTLEVGMPFVLGVVPVDNPEKWCCIDDGGIHEKNPLLRGTKDAIGIFGFTRVAGLKLFEGLKINSYYQFQPTDLYKLIQLKEFKDLTRNGKIEKY